MFEWVLAVDVVDHDVLDESEELLINRFIELLVEVMVEVVGLGMAIVFGNVLEEGFYIAVINVADLCVWESLQLDRVDVT